jgi:hypothetical protein
VSTSVMVAIASPGTNIYGVRTACNASRIPQKAKAAPPYIIAR